MSPELAVPRAPPSCGWFDPSVETCVSALVSRFSLFYVRMRELCEEWREERLIDLAYEHASRGIWVGDIEPEYAVRADGGIVFRPDVLLEIECWTRFDRWMDRLDGGRSG